MTRLQSRHHCGKCVTHLSEHLLPISPVHTPTRGVKWTPFVGPRTVGIKVESRLLLPFFFLFEKPLSRFLLLFLLYCGYVGNAFALSKRSGISTGLAAASILSMPARHTAIGIWLFIA